MMRKRKGKEVEKEGKMEKKGSISLIYNRQELTNI
jgi:hypothetical protein